MSFPQRVKWTRRIVIAGIILGYCSYGSGKLGIGELYPFAHWRLYSAPIGINEPYETFRIYEMRPFEDEWRRITVEPTPAFTRKELSYALASWSREAESDSGGLRPLQALAALAEHLSPNAARYKVVKESFFAIPFYADSTAYTTSTLVIIDR